MTNGSVNRPPQLAASSPPLTSTSPYHQFLTQGASGGAQFLPLSQLMSIQQQQQQVAKLPQAQGSSSAQQIQPLLLAPFVSIPAISAAISAAAAAGLSPNSSSNLAPQQFYQQAANQVIPSKPAPPTTVSQAVKHSTSDDEDNTNSDVDGLETTVKSYPTGQQRKSSESAAVKPNAKKSSISPRPVASLSSITNTQVEKHLISF